MHVENLVVGESVICIGAVIDGKLDHSPGYSGWPLTVISVSVPFVIVRPVGTDRINVLDSRNMRFSKADPVYTASFGGLVESGGIKEPVLEEPETPARVDDCVCPQCGGIFAITEFDDGKLWQCQQCEGIIVIPHSPDEEASVEKD